ncbi:hypothetical protein [Aurantimonas sp. 22II-16-19i]|uniref:hypothetical protein n=1 Tax=Aurantimonas sp. 22II-16-19i TaxID=1317114 RepID=UPI00111BF0AB|nr:hypothetical protein [Aurantimonas sp. 22II-16-19i]
MFICIYKEKGKYVAHSTSDKNDFENDFSTQKIKHDAKSLASKKIDADTKFSILFYEFTISMMNYLELLPLVASFTPAISLSLQEKVISEFVMSNGTVLEDEENRTVVRLDGDSEYGLAELLENFSALKTTGQQIPKMLLIGAVSSYEFHVANLMRCIFEMNPRLMRDSEKEVKIHEILTMGDIEDFKKYVLEKEIDHIMRQSAHEQIKWLESSLSIDSIQKSYKDYSILMEIFERRNLFAHSDGVVNKQYINNLKKFSHPDFEKLQIGGHLSAKPKYFNASLRTVAEFGVKLIQICWRKAAKSENENADDMLGNFCLELINRGEYQLSSKLLEFATAMRGKKSEMRRRMDIVNLANCYRLMGDSKKSEKTLNAEEWSITSDDFKLCVAAVRGDVSEAVRVMKRIGSEGDIEASTYEGWPVFRGLQTEKEFCQAFEEIFGREFSPRNSEPKSIIGAIIRLSSVIDASEKIDTVALQPKAVVSKTSGSPEDIFS